MEFLFKWYHIEKMKHILQDLSSDIDWLELEYSVESTERAFSQWEHGQSNTLTSLGSEGDQALVLWKHMCERPFVELKLVISYIQVVHL